MYYLRYHAEFSPQYSLLNKRDSLLENFHLSIRRRDYAVETEGRSGSCGLFH